MIFQIRIFTHFPTFCIPIFINFHRYFCVFNLPQGYQWGNLLPYMPSQALAPVAAPLRPAGDGDDGAQTWKQLTRAQTCCWSNLITHIMCHYWAGAGNTNTAPTQYLPSVHTHLMLLYTSIRIFWNKPFIIIDECQNTAQSYSSRPDASTFNLHHQRPHEAGQLYGTCPLHTNWILHRYIHLQCSWLLLSIFLVLLLCIRNPYVSVRTIAQSIIIITSVVSAQRRSH